MRLGNSTPILRIFDEAKAREFYVGYLGFRIDWEHRFAPGMPLYLQVSRDGCVLHLSEHHGDACPGAALRIATEDIDDLQRGDLIFFKSDDSSSVGHVGIYIGSGEMIDASSANGKVVRRGAKTSYWRRNFVVGRRPIV